MTLTDVRSRKELLWLSCKEKRCCSHYTVLLTGLDIWRISQTVQLPPWAFTVYTDAPLDAEDGFALDGLDKRYRVILAKRCVEGQPLSPCVFLWRLPDGHAHCGLGDLRPGACKAYPSIIVNGILCIGDCSGCSCRTWGLAQVERQYETEVIQALDRERAEYREILQGWNERAEKVRHDRQYSYLEFCNYLVNAYVGRYR